MFLKNLVSHFTRQEIDREFWQHYRANIEIYTTKKGERSLLTKNAFIAFAEEKDDGFKYRLYARSRDNKDDTFYFPIHLDPKPELTINPQDQRIQYDFFVDSNLQISVTFVIKNEDYTDAGQFRNIVCRLLYQTKTKKSAANLEDQEVLNSFIVVKDAVKKSDKLLKLFEKMTADKKYEFVGLGKLAQLDPNGTSIDPNIILPTGIFAIEDKGGFTYEMEVIDENMDYYHNKEVSDTLYYYFNDGSKSITWLDLKGSSMICLNFEIERPSLDNLKITMSRVLMQTIQKQSIETIVEKEKNNWDQYYLEPEDNNKKRDVEYNKYADRSFYLDIESEESSHAKAPDFNGDIRGFAQGVKTNRAFINRTDIINVYKYDEENQNFVYLNDLPELTYKDDPLHPSKIQLQEQDGKLAFIDNEQNDRIYYYDIEKSKVIDAFRPEKNIKIKDLSVQGGKTGLFNTTPSILSISENDIYRIDPRSNKPVVQSKNYKMQTGFEKILGTCDDSFAIGSNNGDIRLYTGVGSNAKNLIPSMMHEPVLHMDSSKDASLLLLTFKRYLMLMPTFQNGKNAYGTTFKKDSKPKPIILRVDPQILARFNMPEPTFVSAKFDFKKDETETHIVACCGNILVIWNLAKVLKGNLVARNFLPMEDRIVGGEFLYNHNNLVTALPKNITLNKARVEKV